MNADLETMRWEGNTDGHLSLIDQTLLPTELKRIDCQDVETVWEAIKMLRVRGAPAIGIAAAYGVCVGLQNAVGALRPILVNGSKRSSHTWLTADQPPSICSGHSTA